MLAQRRTWWAIISPALGQRLVFDRLYDRNEWDRANRGKPTFLHLCVQREDIITENTG